ncbi:MAG: Niacin transporter NiaP [uncultured Friedmanniella sp.]|uniref:Niacin transporter NiaP n=1 Tax=uncultured Friedmanniella sp. TaxID=335381 RepID=A0A6J4KZM6_9ACTN|nr:MFS transporter [uncultured Friedmanniella sp.]CAA9315489.1 MAG: Niacin transporter NiaP [uncultured Friedmanniella sp.]
MPRTDTPTRAQRLDVLPFTREHRRLLLGSGTGWALDALDVGLISFILAQLSVQWQLSPGEASAIASIGFVGMAIGAALGGLLADRLGRRQVFALTLLVYGTFTGVSALAWSVGALIVFRFLVGLGLGAELPVASTLVSEFAPARIRGRVVVVLESFWAVGWTLAALIGFLIVPRGDDGWRWALALGAVPALYAVVVRFGLPESVRFLESKGRHDEAEAVVRRFEDSAGTERSPVPVADQPVGPDAAVATTGRGQNRVAALWAAPLRRRTAALWAVWFCVNFSYYGAFIWLPSLLYASGFSLVRSFGYTLLITLAQLPGYAVAAILVEVWGRRRTLVAALLGSAAAAALFASAPAAGAEGGTATVLTAGMLLSFFNLGAWGALYAVTPELYPTTLRGTGSGWAAGAGRIASIVAPLCVPLLSGAGGTGLVFAVFAAVFVLAALAATALPELRGRALAEG